MLESAKRCFQSLAELVGKEVFIKLCMEYVDTNLKKGNIQQLQPQPQQQSQPQNKEGFYYHNSINYEWNMGDLNTYD